MRNFICTAVGLLWAAQGSAQVTDEEWFPGTSSVTEAEVIPPAYRGVWAPSERDCRDEDGVNRFTVYSSGVDTYESGGRLDRVTQAGQERSISLKLSYEGEGRFWDNVETWTLDSSGRQLVLEANGASSTFVRCE